MAKGAKHMKYSKTLIASLIVGLAGVYAVETNKIDISGPSAEVSATPDPIAVASAAYVPPSGGTDEECNNLLQNIGGASMMSSDDARQLEKSYRDDYQAKCMPGK